MDIQMLIILILPAGIVFYLFMDGDDSEIQRRLNHIKENPMSASSKKSDDINSTSFIIQTANNIAKNIADKSKTLAQQKQLLAEAGQVCDDDALLKHLSQKVLYTIAMSILAAVLLLGNSSPFMKLVMLIMGPLLGYRLPDIKLRTKAKKRAEETTYSLPDAIDLLSVCVEAGLGLDSALARVAKEQKEGAPILSEEFERVIKDILAGIPRSDAFRNLIKRNQSVELKSFVSLLIQSDKLGTSISQSLRVYSDALRTKRRQKAEELAAKAGVKMSIPLVLFILPATFIVILAPAAISMISLFMKNPMN